MKRLIFFLTCLTLPLMSQAQDSTDTVKIPRVELNEFFASIDSLQVQNKDLELLVMNQRLEIRKLQFIISQDSLLVSYKDRRIALLEDEIKLHTDYIDRLEKRSWRNSKTLWFLSGVATILVSSVVINNVNQIQVSGN